MRAQLCAQQQAGCLCALEPLRRRRLLTRAPSPLCLAPEQKRTKLKEDLGLPDDYGIKDSSSESGGWVSSPRPSCSWDPPQAVAVCGV